MRTPIAIVFINLLTLGCNPYIYGPEVNTFRDAVNQSAAAFRGFNDRARATYEREQLQPEAEVGTPLAVSSPQCAIPAGDLDNNRLEADALCLSFWAEWRAQPPRTRGPAPECSGNVKPEVKNGELVPYDVSGYYKSQVDQCKLCLRRADGPPDCETLQEAQVFYRESLALLPALSNYADGLAGIVSAEDSDQLRTSVGQAKVATEKLVGQINSITGKEPVSPAVVGGVGDLLGAGLLKILDYQRLKELRRVVVEADPTISTSASLLSQLSLPLLLSELQPEAKTFRQSVAATNDRPRGAEWFRAYAGIQQQRAAYLATLENSPTDLFSAMAESHMKLAERLQDSSVPYEELVAAITDFLAKAEAAYQLFTSTTGSEQPTPN